MLNRNASVRLFMGHGADDAVLAVIMFQRADTCVLPDGRASTFRADEKPRLDHLPRR